jgi:hypothetical protein
MNHRSIVTADTVISRELNHSDIVMHRDNTWRKGVMNHCIHDTKVIKTGRRSSQDTGSIQTDRLTTQAHLYMLHHINIQAHYHMRDIESKKTDRHSTHTDLLLAYVAHRHNQTQTHHRIKRQHTQQKQAAIIHITKGSPSRVRP